MQRRQAFFRFGYTKILKPGILFRLDPESVHNQFLRMGKLLGRTALTRYLTAKSFYYQSPILSQTVNGLHYPNPVGIAAGFDKDAEMIDILPCVGFGHLEVGSVTGQPNPGNARPRLWRLKLSRSIVVNYGLKSAGAEVVSQQIKCSHFAPNHTVPLGISIARANLPEIMTLEDQITDYLLAYQKLYQLADSITINISCPNLEGGQPFCSPHNLEPLLTAVQKARIALAELHGPKPHYLKLSPDQTHPNLEKTVNLALKAGINGFICSNLTKPRLNPAIKDAKVPETGGMSGKVVEELSNQLLEEVYRLTKGQVPLIGCGGIFSAEDAYYKIKHGATLLQLITGMLFEGPQLIGEINRGLEELLKKDGYSSIQEAVGQAL